MKVPFGTPFAFEIQAAAVYQQGQKFNLVAVHAVLLFYWYPTVNEKHDIARE